MMGHGRDDGVQVAHADDDRARSVESFYGHLVKGLLRPPQFTVSFLEGIGEEGSR
jgi:hypothetical protein